LSRLSKNILFLIRDSRGELLIEYIDFFDLQGLDLFLLFVVLPLDLFKLRIVCTADRRNCFSILNWKNIGSVKNSWRFDYINFQLRYWCFLFFIFLVFCLENRLFWLDDVLIGSLKVEFLFYYSYFSFFCWECDVYWLFYYWFEYANLFVGLECRVTLRIAIIGINYRIAILNRRHLVIFYSIIFFSLGIIDWSLFFYLNHICL